MEEYIRSIWPNVHGALEARNLGEDADDLSDRGRLAVHYGTHGLKIALFHAVADGGCTCRHGAKCPSPGKHARSKGWIESATIDAETISGWWLAYPEGNIAIVPGEELVVVDVDARNGGWESFAALTDEHGSLPDTPTSETGGGGAHFIFRRPPRLSAKKSTPWPGIDLLTGPCAFVAPGSIHQSGRFYKWRPGQSIDDLPIADAPAFILDVLSGTHSPNQSLQAPESALKEGRRNSSLHRLTVSLTSGDLPQRVIEELVHAANESWCEVPLPRSEVDSLVASGLRGLPSDTGVRLLTRDELMSLADPEWLIEEVLPKGGNAMLWGDSNVGKTFTALDMGARVATGLDWMGYETRQGHVVYVAAEGASFFKNRVHAWETANKLNLSEHMSFLTEAVQLADPRAVSQLNATILAKKDAPSLVILDTLHRCFVGKDENSSKDAGLLLAGCETIQRETGAAVLLLHHSGKSDTKNYRGSSAFQGALDTVMSLESSRKASIRLRCRKQKDAPAFSDIMLEISPLFASATVRQVDPAPDGEDLDVLLSLVSDMYAGGKKPVTLTQIIEASGIPKTTLHRKLRELVDSGQLFRGGSGVGYLPLTKARRAAA